MRSRHLCMSSKTLVLFRQISNASCDLRNIFNQHNIIAFELKFSRSLLRTGRKSYAFELKFSLIITACFEPKSSKQGVSSLEHTTKCVMDSEVKQVVTNGL